MLLTIDVGNTNLTLGLYEGEQLGRHWRLATDHARMPDEYGLQFLGLLQNAGRTVADLTGIVLASVVPQLDQPRGPGLPGVPRAASRWWSMRASRPASASATKTRRP